MASQQTVYLIEPDSAERRSLAFRLGNLGVEAWPFASGADFVAAVEHLRPRCIILSMHGPQVGLQLMGNLLSRGITWPVIALGQSDDLRTGIEAMKLSAIEFLIKPIDVEALLSALGEGSVALEKSVLTSEKRRLAEQKVASLTARELEIAKALGRGQANKIVAHQLGISVRTVEAHRANIMMKLRVRSLAELVLLVADCGIATGPAAPPPTQPVFPLKAQAKGEKATPSLPSRGSFLREASQGI